MGSQELLGGELRVGVEPGVLVGSTWLNVLQRA